MILEIEMDNGETIFGVEVDTANGLTILVPVSCEITGEHLCWQSWMSEEVQLECPLCVPAYVSFDIVTPDGEQLVDIRNITTF